MKDNFQSKSVPRGTRTIWRYLGALFLLFTFAIGNVWAAVIDLTPDAEVTGTNKKWKEVGGGYVSRNGGGFTISTDGLQTGSGNTYVVFDVAAASTIEAKFINTSTTAYSDKTICCGKVSSTQWTAITNAVSDDTQYQLTIASGDKLTDQTISLPGTKSATTSCTFTATTAGKYAVYWTSSINNKVRLYEIEITESSTPTCTSPEIAWSTQPAGGAVGDADFVASVTTTPAEQTVTWTSSVPAAATVSNGTIHYVAPGFTKISAEFTYSGSDYCEEKVSVNKDIVVPISTDATGENDKYWYYTTAVPSSSPDNGLNYSGTKSGASMYGTKLNSDGYAWFVKPAVAGTLRVGAFKSDGSGSNYAVAVYACDDEGKKSGDALGTLTTPHAGGVSATMDIAAEVEGIYIQRSTSSEGILYFVEFKAAASACAATVPGDISKGDLTAGEITLTAAGSAEEGDTWYWQNAENGEEKGTYGSGTTKNVSAPATWYIRSYNTDANCWSAAKSIEVTAEDFLAHYAISYNKGAYGTGEIAGGEKVEGVAYTLSSDRFTRAGYVQTGWSLTDGGAKEYDLGGSYTTDAAQEFFPVWAETSTYVASFACGATAPSGWTFSNAGTYGAEDATVDYVCNFVTAGTSTPKQDPAEGKDGTTDNDVAFAKNTNAIATYDLGAATTVTALNVTLCGGSGSAFNETIEYLGADGSTVKKTYINSLSAGNWNDNLISKNEIVEDVRYIRVHGASKWVAMKAFSVTYVDLVTKYNVTFAKNGGSGADMATLKYAENAVVTLPSCSFTPPDDHVFDGWAVTKTASGDPITVTDGKFTMPAEAVTATAQWATISDFDVKFFQGYGEPDVQIGETQSISTGEYATAPTDPTREGYNFKGWSYDATEEHIVNVDEYAITAATNFTAIWKQVFIVTFDGAGSVNVESGSKVASPDSPSQADKVFQGWYNGESKYDFSAAVTGNLALESKWAAADPNHYVYAYNDDFHFDGVVYKTPEGKVDNNDLTSNKAITTPYTLFSGAGGITSIVATGAIYDSKGTHVNAFLKLDTKASSYLTVTIASGYTAVMKVKMGSWNVGSAAPTVTFVDEDDTPVSYTGTMEGKAEDNNYAELTYNLSAGTYKMTTATKTLYFSNMDIEATALPTHTVTYKAGEGTGDDVVDADATNVADVPSTFTAPTGQVFNGWKDELDNDVEVGAIVSADMALTAQWINVYAVTFNMNGHGDDIESQDVKEGAKAAKPADPSESGWIFGGWFTDNGTFEAPFDFNTLITAATPLYAKWTADPCPTPFSLSKVVLTSATDGTVTGYNNDEYAGEKVIGGLGESQTADVDPSHEGVETGYKLSSGGSAIVFATLKKGTFQVGDRVVVTITKAQDAYKVEEVAQPILDIYYGTDKNDATFLTTIENVTAAGTYTYRLTAADVTAIGSKTGIGVFRPSSGRTQNPYVYSVEIKGCREWAIFHTLTFKNIDGTATIADESLEEGVAASTVAPAAPKITLKRFLGWAEATDGSPVDLTTYTITDDKILYAVYEDIVCPTNGTVYKFEIKDELPSENLPTSTDKDMSSYITATGDGYLTYTATANNKATINSDGTILMKDASAAYLKVELECALAAGDQIRAHVTNNPMRVQVGTTYDSDKDLILAKNAYEFVAITSAMEGKQVLYITRSSNGNAYLADFEIYRPAKYDVSFNMMGHGSAIADIEDVIEGSKITAPTAPTDEDYSFAGWYKENTLVNEWKFDVDVVEANTTLYAKWLDKSDATLKSLKYGDTEIALEAGVYTYNVSLPAFTSAVPALTAETSNPNATKVIANATAFDSEGNATSTVTVTPEVGADQEYTVNFAKGVEILLQDVTGSITWNFANAVTANVNITGTPQVLANYGGVTNDNTFESDKLEASGEKFTAGNKANLRANYIHFHTTVPGMLTISYSNTGGSNPARYIYVNGAKYDEEGSANTTPKGADNKVFVPAGDVELVMKDGEDASKNVQIYQMIFNATPDYTRDVTEGKYGTICLPNGGVMTNATIYTLAYFGETSQKFFFDEVLGGVMEAGKPYLFLPEQGVTELKVFYTDSETKAAQTVNGFVGFIGANEDDYTQVPDNEKCYIIQNNTYRQVLAGAEAYIKSYRAYIDRSEDNVPLVEPAKAPGARRIGLGKDAAQGFENLQSGDQPMKVMIDGTLYIIRGEKIYNANGQVVK